MKDYKSPHKQQAAQRRNWKIKRLKGAIGFLSHILDTDLTDLEKQCADAIDRQWKEELISVGRKEARKMEQEINFLESIPDCPEKRLRLKSALRIQSMHRAWLDELLGIN